MYPVVQAALWIGAATLVLATAQVVSCASVESPPGSGGTGGATTSSSGTADGTNGSSGGGNGGASSTGISTSSSASSSAAISSSVSSGGCSVDADQDGHPSLACGGDDCDDLLPDVHPGATEICDHVDNDCSGVPDDSPSIDWTSPVTCGTCENDCTKGLVNVDPATVTCIPSAQPGQSPGICKGICQQDYHDLDANGSCEYYCVQATIDDAVCNDKDDDCDGIIDEDVDHCTSLTDCGGCGHNCVVLHGAPSCIHAGGNLCDTSNTQCAIQKCDCAGPGNCWWDVDGSYATGCEYSCSLTNSGVEKCDGVDNDCNGVIDDGCP